MPLLLIHGDNNIEIDEAITGFRTRFDEASTLSFDGTSISMATLSEACLTMGLFDPERLVLVHDLHERLKGSRRGSPALEEWGSVFASVVPTTTLVLVCRNMSADSPLVTTVERAGGEVRAYATPRRNDLPPWIVARVKRAGVTMDRAGADLLADLVGADVLQLQSEIEKLATYVGEKGQITAADVGALVGAVSQESVFALVDAVAAGDRAKALQLLRRQVETASTPADFAFYLIRMLARQIRILLRVRTGTEAGRSIREVMAEAKVPPYYADRYARQARRLSPARLAGFFELLAALEHELKSGKAEPGTGLDLLVTEMCG